jgi:putative membrane protein
MQQGARMTETPISALAVLATHRGRAPRVLLGANWLDAGSLVVAYGVSLASLVGFATFGLHPQMLARAGVSAETYARILVVVPRAQIIIAFCALGAFLVRRTGTRWVAAFLVVYLVSLAAELAGTTLGLPFGPYRYTDGLGIKWFGHVPALIPLSWFMMALPSYTIAERRFQGANTVLQRVALGSFILLSWDFALDPAMSFATKYWIWGATGPYYGMPILYLVGWFATGVVLMVAFARLRVDRWADALPAWWLIAFYGANLLLPVGMSVAAGLWGVVVATGVAFAIAALIALTAPDRGRAA